MRIVVCGDSFNASDDRFPGLHWADRLAPHEVFRLARGGASNFSIWHQVAQSLRFDPDLVLISFTSCPRVEYIAYEPTFYSTLVEPWRAVLLKSKDFISGMLKHHHEETPIEGLRQLEAKIQKDVSPISHAIPMSDTGVFEQWVDKFYIEPFDILKNYIYISSALNNLAENHVPCLATLGGFEKHRNSQVQHVTINFEKHNHVLQLANPWNTRHDGEPVFHIADTQWHEQYAQRVLELAKEVS